eukprot:Sdes_comp20886_c0_seq1m17945
MEPQKPFHLHRLAFLNDHKKLANVFKSASFSSLQELHQLDFRGFTPLHISVMKNHFGKFDAPQTPFSLSILLTGGKLDSSFQECASLLLKMGAVVKRKSLWGWDALDEAISMGNRDMIRLLFKARKEQSKKNSLQRISLLSKEFEEVNNLVSTKHSPFFSS